MKNKLSEEQRRRRFYSLTFATSNVLCVRCEQTNCFSSTRTYGRCRVLLDASFAQNDRVVPSTRRSPRRDLNSRPLVYKTSALTPELRRQALYGRHNWVACSASTKTFSIVYWSRLPGSLQWHSRLARRTYKSVTTKKCEGREFEPLLEQSFRNKLSNLLASC